MPVTTARDHVTSDELRGLSKHADALEEADHLQRVLPNLRVHRGASARLCDDWLLHQKHIFWQLHQAHLRVAFKILGDDRPVFITVAYARFTQQKLLSLIHRGVA